MLKGPLDVQLRRRDIPVVRDEGIVKLLDSSSSHLLEEIAFVKPLRGEYLVYFGDGLSSGDCSPLLA